MKSAGLCYCSSITWVVFCSGPERAAEASLAAAAFLGKSDQKIAHLRDCYASQTGKPWFETILFRSVARIRRMECTARAGLAKAFYLRELGLSA